MTLRVPEDVPGFGGRRDPTRGPTPQPVRLTGWLALLRRIWVEWQRERDIERQRRESGRIL